MFGRRIYPNHEPCSAVYLTYSFQMDKKNMLRYSPYVEPLGTTMLQGYRIAFRNEPDHYGLATIEKAESDCVPVVLWRVPASHETALDRCCPDIYHKMKLEVMLEGEPTPCFTYVLNDNYPLSPPTIEYLQLLLDRYVSFRFCVNPLRLAYRDAYDHMSKSDIQGGTSKG